jgi:hypothetical protein
MLRRVTAVPAACLLIAGAVASFPVAVAAAPASWPTVGSGTVTASGVPSHVNAGGTLSFTVNFVEHSPYAVHRIELSFQVWNASLSGPDQIEGTTAAFLNPATGSWQTSYPASGDSYGMEMIPDIVVQPGQTLSVPVRLNVRPFRNGTYRLTTYGTVISVRGADGQDMQAMISFPDAAPHTFTIGSTTGANPPATPRLPSAHGTKPTPHTGSTAVVAGTTATITATGTPTAASPSADPSSGSPAAAPTSLRPLAGAPSPQSAGTLATVVIMAVVAAALGGAGLAYRIRRRRLHGSPQQTVASHDNLTST